MKHMLDQILNLLAAVFYQFRAELLYVVMALVMYIKTKEVTFRDFVLEVVTGLIMLSFAGFIVEAMQWSTALTLVIAYALGAYGTKPVKEFIRYYLETFFKKNG